MTVIQQQANAVLNAMDEARVSTVIRLVEDGRLLHPTNWGSTRYDVIRNTCEYLGIKDISYWLDEWFKYPKGT